MTKTRILLEIIHDCKNGNDASLIYRFAIDKKGAQYLQTELAKLKQNICISFNNQNQNNTNNNHKNNKNQTTKEEDNDNNKKNDNNFNNNNSTQLKSYKSYCTLYKNLYSILKPYFARLSMHNYGNYVIQKFLYYSN